MLFERLIRARLAARRVKSLCNIPVWIWLVSGDEHVPAAAGAEGPGDLGARLITDAVGPRPSCRQGRGGWVAVVDWDQARRMVALLLTDALERGTLDEVRLTQTLADQPDAEGHLCILRARFEALGALSSIDDDTYLHARTSYRAVNLPRHPGDPDFGESVTNACLVLLTLIGFGIVARGRGST
jgi:hypothetical protein